MIFDLPRPQAAVDQAPQMMKYQVKPAVARGQGLKTPRVACPERSQVMTTRMVKMTRSITVMQKSAHLPGRSEPQSPTKLFGRQEYYIFAMSCLSFHTRSHCLQALHTMPCSHAAFGDLFYSALLQHVGIEMKY